MFFFCNAQVKFVSSWSNCDTALIDSKSCNKADLTTAKESWNSNCNVSYIRHLPCFGKEFFNSLSWEHFQSTTKDWGSGVFPFAVVFYALLLKAFSGSQKTALHGCISWAEASGGVSVFSRCRNRHPKENLWPSCHFFFLIWHHYTPHIGSHLN